jgi:L-aminopeptidase/D-esterase-like protein
MLAADCVARAIARGVFQAERMGDFDSYRDRYGR